MHCFELRVLLALIDVLPLAPGHVEAYNFSTIGRQQKLHVSCCEFVMRIKCKNWISLHFSTIVAANGFATAFDEFRMFADPCPAAHHHDAANRRAEKW